jgi:hypothetical protein
MIPRDRAEVSKPRRRSRKSGDETIELLGNSLSYPVEKESGGRPLDGDACGRPYLEGTGWPFPLESPIKVWVGYDEDMNQKVSCAPGYSLSVSTGAGRNKIRRSAPVGRKHNPPRGAP